MKKLTFMIVCLGEVAILVSALWESGVLGSVTSDPQGVIRAASAATAILIDIGGPWPQMANGLGNGIVMLLSFVALYLLCKFLGAVIMQSLKGNECGSL